MSWIAKKESELNDDKKTIEENLNLQRQIDNRRIMFTILFST